MHSGDENQVHPRKLPQFIASQSAAIGIFAAGVVFGWTSSAGEDGANLRYSFEINSDEFSWISSVSNIGGALMSIPTGILTNLIGRRTVMLILTVPYTIGWSCVIWPDSIATLIIGRFILGASGGAFFVTLPMYTTEIADKETRGELCSFLILLFYTGILVAYSLGLLQNMFLQSLISATVPLIFFAIFFFMPESPTYYLMKGNVEAARKTLIWLRGTQYDVESELEEKKNGLVEAEESKTSFFVGIRSRAAFKSLLIGYSLIFFFSVSGIDAILAYASSIFADATGGDGNLFAIGISAMQIVSLFLFSFVVDKWGRRVLLLISGSVMSLSALVFGIYFYLLYANGTSMDDFLWVPVVCLSSFVVFFSFGFAAIPWIIGELFSPQIKATAMSSATAGNWFLVFFVVQFFSLGKEKIGLYGVFWIYSAIIALGVVFVYFVVPETKNKSLEQIQIELRAKVHSDRISQCTKL